MLSWEGVEQAVNEFIDGPFTSGLQKLGYMTQCAMQYVAFAAKKQLAQSIGEMQASAELRKEATEESSTPVEPSMRFFGATEEGLDLDEFEESLNATFKVHGENKAEIDVVALLIERFPKIKYFQQLCEFECVLEQKDIDKLMASMRKHESPVQKVREASKQ